MMNFLTIDGTEDEGGSNYITNRQFSNMNQKIVIFVTAAILLTSCHNKGAQTQEEAVKVSTQKVEAGAQSVNKNFMGVIEEEDGANVTFSVLGTVIRVMVDEGQFVRKGQAMAETEQTHRPQLNLGMQISIVLIFFIIVFHLKSIPLTLLIMASLAFSMLGGTLGLFLFGQEFGATGILGFISLMGIITRCGIIMIDYAEELRREHPTKEAALLSAKRRFRPVFLTSMAASMGVTLMVIKNTPLWGVERSVENLRINREHYINGMKNMTELLDAQRQWQQALTARNAANCEYLQAKTRYLILTGRREQINH